MNKYICFIFCFIFYFLNQFIVTAGERYNARNITQEELPQLVVKKNDSYFEFLRKFKDTFKKELVFNFLISAIPPIPEDEYILEDVCLILRTFAQKIYNRDIAFKILENEVHFYFENSVLDKLDFSEINTNKILNIIPDVKRQYTDENILLSEISMVNGKLHGYCRTYYLTKINDAHIMKSSSIYINGFKEGPEYEYYEDGTLKQIRNYYKNVLHGDTMSFDKKGQLTDKLPYHFGDLFGNHEVYENNKLLFVFRYRKGELID